jgi:uncharacterized membrane protein
MLPAYYPQAYYTQQWQGVLGWILVAIVIMSLISELFRGFKGFISG